MIYDTFMLFNELDLLELRLNILDDYVDWFIISESEETFSGMPKPLFFKDNLHRFDRWNHKIIYSVLGTIKASSPFERAYSQKASALQHITDPEAEIYFGDLDEIWMPQQDQGKVIKLHQYNYCYYLNQRSSEDWYGTIYGKRKYFDKGFNELRASAERVPIYAGWHFTNMGGPDQILKKVAAYDHSHELNQNWMKDHIKENMEKGLDYIGRETDYQGKPFTFWLEEENWPEYLKENREQYKHLLI